VNGYFTLATEAHDDDGCPHVRDFVPRWQNADIHGGDIDFGASGFPGQRAIPVQGWFWLFSSLQGEMSTFVLNVSVG
jgi:hypothetical protein